MPSPTLPLPDAVARLLRDLLGKGVSAKKCGVLSPSAKLYAASYADDADKVVSVGVCDLPFAASAGAALALVPPGVAAEAVRAGLLPAELSENLREVLNVMASLFGATHVRLRDVVSASAAQTVITSVAGARATARLDIELAVAGYSGGKLSFLIV